MNRDDLKAIIHSGETETVEFKKSFDREAIETLVAFANTRGGCVLVGVADNGSISGVTLGKETLNDWLGQVKSTTSPAIIPDIDAYQVDGRTVVVMKVGEYPVKPISTRGRYFKRVVSSNHQLRLSEITDLYMQSLQLSWDANAAQGESLDALSVGKIERFIEQVNQSGRFTLDQSPLLALEKLKYIVDGRLTWAALLLFSENPMRQHIHIGRFKTPSVIIDDHQITDTLFEAVEHAMKVIVSHISVAFEFDGGLQRRERFTYPLPALREVLLNAVVHRDYTNPSDIQIKIFDDQITFFSPGKLYGGLTIDDLKTDYYQSHLRNKLIAEAFYLTKNIEKYGSGFIRIRKELEAYPELEFNVIEMGDGLLVVFQVKARKSEGVSEGVGGGVSEGVKRLLVCIKDNPGLRIPELSEMLQVSPKTVERWVKQLRDENLIMFKGAPKTGGYFPVNPDQK